MKVVVFCYSDGRYICKTERLNTSEDPFTGEESGLYDVFLEYPTKAEYKSAFPTVESARYYYDSSSDKLDCQIYGIRVGGESPITYQSRYLYRVLVDENDVISADDGTLKMKTGARYLITHATNTATSLDFRQSYQYTGVCYTEFPDGEWVKTAIDRVIRFCDEYLSFPSSVFNGHQDAIAALRCKMITLSKVEGAAHDDSVKKFFTLIQSEMKKLMLFQSVNTEDTYFKTLIDLLLPFQVRHYADLIGVNNRLWLDDLFFKLYAVSGLAKYIPQRFFPSISTHTHLERASAVSDAIMHAESREEVALVLANQSDVTSGAPDAKARQVDHRLLPTSLSVPSRFSAGVFGAKAYRAAIQDGELAVCEYEGGSVMAKVARCVN